MAVSDSTEHVSLLQASAEAQHWQKVLGAATTAVVAGAVAAVAATVQAFSPPGVPVAVLPSGAIFAGTTVNGVAAYFGIRYAKAARFEVPTHWEPPAGTITNATSDGSKCPQIQFQKKPPEWEGQEDCLFLNIFAPQTSGEKAVMLWIHGGALTFGDGPGATNVFTKGLSTFANQSDVIVVTLNYRLNVFGFFTDPDPSAPSNFGLRDQIAALQWLNRNVQSFGGNPGRVTLIGQSSGALSVLALHQSPLAQPFFQRAIAQSPAFNDPSFFHAPSSKAAASLGQECLKALNCTSAACARRKPLPAVIWLCHGYSSTNRHVLDVGTYVAGADGEVLPEPLQHPACSRDFAEQKTKAPKPLLVGSIPHEWRFFVSKWGKSRQVVNKFLHEYLHGYANATQDLQTCAQNELHRLYGGIQHTCPACAGFREEEDAAWVQLGTDVEFTLATQLAAASGIGQHYRYLMDFEDAGGPFGATHGSDLCFIVSPDPTTCGTVGIRNTEKSRARHMLWQYWAAFAKEGVPSSELGPRWEPVVPGNLAGVPFLRLRLGDASVMQDSPWVSNATARTLAEVACGRLQLSALPEGQCALVPIE